MPCEEIGSYCNLFQSLFVLVPSLSSLSHSPRAVLSSAPMSSQSSTRTRAKAQIVHKCSLSRCLRGTRSSWSMMNPVAPRFTTPPRDRLKCSHLTESPGYGSRSEGRMALFPLATARIFAARTLHTAAYGIPKTPPPKSPFDDWPPPKPLAPNSPNDDWPVVTTGQWRWATIRLLTSVTLAKPPKPL
jgi:hypothetical protein